MLAVMGLGASRAVLSVVLVSVAVSDCATLRNAINFEQPQIALQQINITGMGLSGGTLDLVFDVYNPNEYRLRSTRLEVDLALASTEFGQALIDKPLDLSTRLWFCGDKSRGLSIRACAS